MAQAVKRLSTIQETRVRSLDGEDLLEKEMATHSSIPAWKIPWTEEPGRLQSMGSQRVGHDWATSLSLSLYKWGKTGTEKLSNLPWSHSCWTSEMRFEARWWGTISYHPWRPILPGSLSSQEVFPWICRSLLLWPHIIVCQRASSRIPGFLVKRSTKLAFTLRWLSSRACFPQIQWWLFYHGWQKLSSG